jgi:hypothetical protein
MSISMQRQVGKVYLVANTVDSLATLIACRRVLNLNGQRVADLLPISMYSAEIMRAVRPPSTLARRLTCGLLTVLK